MEDPTGPVRPLSIVAFIVIVCSTVFMTLIMIPFLFRPKLRRDYPNSLIFWIAITGLLGNTGFFIAGSFDFNPAKYELDGLCVAQWVFLGVGGGSGLMIIFFYIVGLYQIVCLGQQSRHMTNYTKYVVIFTFATASITQLAIPFAFPHTYEGLPEGDSREGNTVYFGPQGPWCGIKDLLTFTIIFYLYVIPPCIISLYLGIRILKTVMKTTQATAGTLGSDSSPSSPMSSFAVRTKYKARQMKLMRFYGRVSIFIITYSVATIIGMITRISQIRRGYSPDDPNNAVMGTSIVLPIMVFVQGLVLLSTPAISRFYSKEMPAKFLGKQVTTTTEGTVNEKEGSIQPSAMLSRDGSQFGSFNNKTIQVVDENQENDD